MRIVHLCFDLHAPFTIRNFDAASMNDSVDQVFFDTAEDFAKRNSEIYQPLFALLERNTQRYPNWHFSLRISGTWLDLAEKYDPELITRLKKLLKLGRIELIAEPYYHSLALFYDQTEYMEQIELEREKMRKLFGQKLRFLALPEFLYNNAIAAQAEQMGFAGMLLAGSAMALGGRNANHIYEAAGCKYLRLLVGNTALKRQIVELDPSLLVEQKDEQSGKDKLVLSATKVIKRLELESLRGGVVNLYFAAEIFRDLQRANIVRFFDDFLQLWQQDSDNHLMNAAEAVVAEEPTMMLDVPAVVDERTIEEDQDAQSFELYRKKIRRRYGLDEDIDESKKSEVREDVTLLPVLARTTDIKIPMRFRSPLQSDFAERLYGLRREVMASEDLTLISCFRRLTDAEYQINLDSEKAKNFSRILDDLRRRIGQVKKAQVVEISRNFTKKRDRGVETVSSEKKDKVDDNVVTVKRQHRRSPEVEQKATATVNRHEENDDNIVQVRRVSSSVMNEHAEKAKRQAKYEEAKKVEPEISAGPSVLEWDDIAEGEIEDENVDKVAQDDNSLASRKSGGHRSIRKIIRKLVIE